MLRMMLQQMTSTGTLPELDAFIGSASYDIREVIKAIGDGGNFFEIYEKRNKCSMRFYKNKFAFGGSGCKPAFR